MVRTKVVATVGPASDSEEMLLELIAAGTDTFRLNMSHGDMDEKRALIRRIRELTKSGRAEPFCILGDLGGPKVRVGKLTGGKVKLEEGSTVNPYLGRDNRGRGPDSRGLREAWRGP